jgi:GNAT superfamily N-acetyltransferase
LPGLRSIRYHDQPAIHRDRISASDQRTLQYFVAAIDQQLVGFGLLLLERPPQWSDPLDSFPILVDLFVAEAFRSRGVGRALLQHLEEVARQHSKPAVYLSVEPFANPRALQLYKRLGYTPLQEEPYHNAWQFTDSEGVTHTGEELVIDMRKVLTGI